MDEIGISAVSPSLDLSEGESYGHEFGPNKYTSAWTTPSSFPSEQHSTPNGRAVVAALKALQAKLSRLQADKEDFKAKYEKTRELLIKKQDEHALVIMQMKSDLSAATEFSDAIKTENTQLKRQIATYTEVLKKQKQHYAQDKQMIVREYDDAARVERKQQDARLDEMTRKSTQAEQKSKNEYENKLESVRDELETVERLRRIEREASAENARRLEISEDDVMTLRHQIQTLTREKTELQTMLIGFQSSAKAQLNQLKTQLQQQRQLNRKKEQLWSEHLEEILGFDLFD